MKLMRHLIVRFLEKSHKLSGYDLSVAKFYCAQLKGFGFRYTSSKAIVVNLNRLHLLMMCVALVHTLKTWFRSFPLPFSFSAEGLFFDLNRVCSITVAHAQVDAIKADVLVLKSSLTKPYQTFIEDSMSWTYMLNCMRKSKTFQFPHRV